MVQRRRQLVESEQRRRVQMQALVDMREISLALTFIADTVREAALERVSDPVEQRAVLAHVQRAFDRVAGPRPGGE